MEQGARLTVWAHFQARLSRRFSPFLGLHEIGTQRKGPERIGAFLRLECFRFALLLFLAWFFARRLRGRWRRLRGPAHPFLEASNAFAQAAHDLGNSAPTKENQNNGEDHQPVKNAKFAHELPPSDLSSRAHREPVAL